MKRVGAILLFILSGLLSIGFITQLINTLTAIVALFSGELNAYQSGEAIGIIMFQIFLIVLTAFIIKKGRSLLNNSPES